MEEEKYIVQSLQTVVKKEILNDEKNKNYIYESLQTVVKEEILNNENIESIEIKLIVEYEDALTKTYLLTYKRINDEKMFSVTSIIEIKQNEMTIKGNKRIIESKKEISYNINYLQVIKFEKIIQDITDNYNRNFNIDRINNIKKIDIESTKINMKKEGQQEPTQGGKLKAKGQKKKPSKKPVVYQSKENKYKEVLGKRMKIYKKPDSRKEFVRYKGELVALVEYKKSKKEMAKSKNAKK